MRGITRLLSALDPRRGRGNKVAFLVAELLVCGIWAVVIVARLSQSQVDPVWLTIAIGSGLFALALATTTAISLIRTLGQIVPMKNQDSSTSHGRLSQ